MTDRAGSNFVTLIDPVSRSDPIFVMVLMHTSPLLQGVHGEMRVGLYILTRSESEVLVW